MNTVFSDLRDALNSGNARRLQALKKFYGEYDVAEYEFRLCTFQKIAVKKFKVKYPALATALQMIFDERRANPNYLRNFNSFLQTIDYRKIPGLIAKLSDERLLQALALDREQIAKKNPAPANPLDNREREYRELFRQKYISLRPDTVTALKILRNYHEIRHERNQINHANEYSTTKISELRQLIEDCLAALEKITA